MIKLNPLDDVECINPIRMAYLIVTSVLEVQSFLRNTYDSNMMFSKSSHIDVVVDVVYTKYKEMYHDQT